jgi:N-methylhydantoinase A
VTDANLLLGRLGADSPLAGGVQLDREAAARAIGELAHRLELEPVACAEGILRVAVAEMVRALRVVTVNRGIDPRRFVLLAFGGAGPLHATDIADELGMDRILCPRHSGVLAALGLLVSNRRRDAQRTVLLGGGALTDAAIRREVEALGQAARQALGEPEARLEATFEMRYRGQSFELAIPGAADAPAEELRRRFEAAHAERYGFRDPEQPVELVTIRLTAVSPGAEVGLEGLGSGAVERVHRKVTIDGAECLVAVIRGEPGPGTAIAGPAVVELPESTALIAPGWSGTVDATGTLVLERSP